MKNLTSVILIIAGLGLGIYGITKFRDSGKSVEVAGIELSAKDKSGQQEAYLLMGLGVVCLISGVYVSRRK